ncbi:Acetoacetyl-CoA synthetase like protein [Argiope bruennichi]|uniref:Acetoacetyl-CoA synthetase like protein n=1 Tax=Argiope bruennichi TaxID=94029 RepID=A0A8T0EYK0_ARGBR|nr:Acetoacetyl-CoA synthetase like protein [Argiope bruennichi]
MLGIRSVQPYTNTNHASNKNVPPKAKGKKGLVDIISAGTRQIWNKKVPGTQMEKLQNIIQDKYGVKFENYWDFHEWSIKNYSQFWEEIWNFYEVVCSKPYDQPSRRTGDRVIDVEWFPGARLNYAENILRYRDDGVALICVGILKMGFYCLIHFDLLISRHDLYKLKGENKSFDSQPTHMVGWNLWNLYVGNLMLGSSLLLYDGLPCFLSKHAFWDVMDKYKVTFAFIVTSIIDTFEKEDIVPAPDCKLEHLKLISIGASPVKLQNVDFILQKVKPDVFVGCLYGATEVIGVFSGFDYNSPVYSSEIQCPALGVDIRIFDDEGNSIVGKSGELVIATPTPSFPVSVWNDEDGSKMQDTYLSKFPNVWAQSDEAWIDPKTRGMIIIGRSDNTIKQHGERFVSEEIYWAIHDVEEIADSICVAQSNGSGDGRAVLFVKMKNGHVLDKDMTFKIEEKILKELTIFYIPKVILQVKDIPYNLNGKRMESVVKKIVNTNVIPEVSNIRNPECLRQYWNIPQLQDF